MTRSRPGFTLIEALVSLGVVALLAAILVPAVQHVRESARRTACQNNLRQAAAAVELHDSSQQRMPPLWHGSFLPQPRHAIDEFHFHSWRTAILPQLGMAAFAMKIDLALPATDPSNQPNLNVPLPIFLCPSNANPRRNVPDIWRYNDGAFPVEVVGTAARADYEAIGGVASDELPLAGGNLFTNTRYGVWGEPRYAWTLLKSLGYRAARLSDASDGLSNTLLIAERAGRPDYYEGGELKNPFPYRETDPGADHHQAAWGVSTHFAWLLNGPEQSINQRNSDGIYSFHRGGANVAMADTSTRFLAEATDPQVLAALISRADGDVAELP